MTRKKAIINLILFCISILVGVLTFRWYRSDKMKNINSLGNLIDLTAEIAEIIIPLTDTPGAKEAKVSEYIIKMVVNCISIKDRNNFLSGLKALENYSLNNFSESFIKCDKNNKILTLQYFENKGTYSNAILNKIHKKILGRSFFEILKELTVSGYCNSMLGATQGLAYDHIPVHYNPCIPIRPGQKSWATK